MTVCFIKLSSIKGLVILKKVFEVSSVFIGLVIGAGFASGREIFEYFNLAGKTDVTGIVLASIFFGIISYILINFSSELGCDSFGSFIKCVMPKTAFIMDAFMQIYMFCGLFVMFSGASVLLCKTLGTSPLFSTVCFAAVCFIIFSFNIKGLVAVNVLLVPAMVLGILALCIFSGITAAKETFFSYNEIKHNPLISALCYVSYNTITAGAVIIPVSAGISRKTAAKSAIIGGGVLGLAIFLIWNTQNIFYDQILVCEMPLFEIAAAHGRLFEGLYAVVLLAALLTTAVSYGFGILEKMCPPTAPGKIAASFLLCAVCIPFSRLGFSDLIANLYFLFGAVGLLWLGFLLLAYLKKNRT